MKTKQKKSSHQIFAAISTQVLTPGTVPLRQEVSPVLSKAPNTDNNNFSLSFKSLQTKLKMIKNI